MDHRGARRSPSRRSKSSAWRATPSTGTFARTWQPLVYVPMAQADAFSPLARFAVKARGPIAGLMPSIERAVAEINPAIAVRTRVARQAVRNGLVRERLMAALSACIRRAGRLAGGGRSLRRAVLHGDAPLERDWYSPRDGREPRRRAAHGDRGVGVAGRDRGCVIGLALALGAGRAARALLFGLQPADPSTIAAAMLLLAAIGLRGQLCAGSPRLARRSDERIKTGIEPQGSNAWNRSRTMPLEHLELLEPWNG